MRLGDDKWLGRMELHKDLLLGLVHRLYDYREERNLFWDMHCDHEPPSVPQTFEFSPFSHLATTSHSQ